MKFTIVSAIFSSLRAVKSFFSAILQKKASQTLRRVGLFCIFAFLFVPGITHAAFSDIASPLVALIANINMYVANAFIAIAIFFLKWFIQLAGYNGYMDAQIVNLGWVMVRDLANMFFVVALLVIAFGTILGLDQYEWKKSMVQLILMAIFINFSKLICGIIIDASYVFTMTFLNAVVAVAGGNFINMFKLGEIRQMVDPSSTGFDTWKDFDLAKQLFIASLFAVVFAAMAMFTIGAYAIMMLLRMVVLWVLIILSPFAYIFSVLPQTKSYAQEWWHEFTSHVIVAPVAVFFLWLAFATMGTGTIGSEISSPENNPFADSDFTDANNALDTATGERTAQSPSLLSATMWHNMSSFMVAIAFLIIGIERVQKLGVRGGGIASGALNFGKKVAMYAAGVKAVQWMVGDGSKEKGGLLWRMPYIGGRALKTQKQDLKNWALKQGTLPKDQQSLLGLGVGYFARREAGANKALRKNEEREKTLEGLLSSRSTAEAGGMFSSGSIKLSGLKAGVNSKVTEQDIKNLARIEEGELAGEKKRSAAKDKELHTAGENRVLSQGRIKSGGRESGTVADEIAQRETRGKIYEEQQKRAMDEARVRAMGGNDASRGRYDVTGNLVVGDGSEAARARNIALGEAQTLAQLASLQAHNAEGAGKYLFRNTADGQTLVAQIGDARADHQSEDNQIRAAEEAAMNNAATRKNAAAHTGVNSFLEVAGGLQVDVNNETGNTLLAKLNTGLAQLQRIQNPNASQQQQIQQHEQLIRSLRNLSTAELGERVRNPGDIVRMGVIGSMRDAELSHDFLPYAEAFATADRDISSRVYRSRRDRMAEDAGQRMIYSTLYPDYQAPSLVETNIGREFGQQLRGGTDREGAIAAAVAVAQGIQQRRAARVAGAPIDARQEAIDNGMMAGIDWLANTDAWTDDVMSGIFPDNNLADMLRDYWRATVPNGSNLTPDQLHAAVQVRHRQVNMQGVARFAGPPVQTGHRDAVAQMLQAIPNIGNLIADYHHNPDQNVQALVQALQGANLQIPSNVSTDVIRDLGLPTTYRQLSPRDAIQVVDAIERILGQNTAERTQNLADLQRRLNPTP